MSFTRRDITKLFFFPFNSNPKSESVDNPLYEGYEVWIYLFISKEQSLSRTSFYLKAHHTLIEIDIKFYGKINGFVTSASSRKKIPQTRKTICGMRPVARKDRLMDLKMFL